MTSSDKTMEKIAKLRKELEKYPVGLLVENPAEWLVTPLMQDKPALTLDLAKDTLNEAAMLYRPNGDGFLVGPLGPPVAYCNVQFVDQSLVRCAVKRLPNHALRCPNRQIRELTPELLDRLFALQPNLLARSRDDLLCGGAGLALQLLA